ncbi:phospholipase A-2-activating protein [Cryptococcus bacillisporus CA1873]|uniref:Phospholipase A-2-activating protein n=1 Tax=Cryptococcus bacillisporus CA1873 TaxID=1296111 RepID=A0ABR5B7N2_CRYGA|nr:phospholipase A-2-activating protein [Cryptococcus bacillisporus CA1873]|eukprot:KIR59591.1 phospholipase A-2-activating protein [Cryptococcus gattii CA1873]
MPKQYKLAFSLHGHASDVRNVTAPSQEVPLLLSASRDGSAIVWGPSNASREWDVKLRVEGPEKRYVSCTGMVSWGGQAFLLVGSSSGILASYVLPAMDSPAPADDSPLPEPTHTLIEHSQNLCCMDVSQGGLIASGSWDKTVIVWKDFKKVIQIKAHEQAVWSVKFVGEDRILTASADKKIILHSFDPASGRTTPIQTYTGHTEPVRGLALRADRQGFWSCANDGNVNIYSFENSPPIRTLSGHTSFVYSIATFPDGSGAITTGEDGTMRVWSETELVQTIPHTSNSLWSCAVVPSLVASSPYIVSSSSDSTIRFFTNEGALVAGPEELAAWDNEVKGRQLDKSQVGDVKHSDLPGIEALGREGKKDGQVLMIKNNGVVEAYQWSAPSSTWQQIGQVVDAIGQGRKQLYEGKEYDYVFDVDVSEGMPPLKLPYNVAENPWIAAQRFLERHELPTSYVEQVVEFIQKNTGGVQLGTGGDTASYADPFTGSSRYTGGGVPTTGAGGNSGGFGDPFTGGSRYTGGSVSTAGNTTSSGDPFTGGSRYTGGAIASSAPVQQSGAMGILPVRTYLPFKQINVSAAKNKIQQFNDELKTSKPELALTLEEEKTLTEVYAFLSLPAVALPDPKSQDGKEKFDTGAILALIQKWPEDKRFPLIDLARVLAATSPAFALSPPHPFFIAASLSLPFPDPPSKSRETNTLLALRAIANLFVTANGRMMLSTEDVAKDILTNVGRVEWGKVGKNVRIAGATIVLHLSILAVEGNLPAALGAPLLDLINQILDSEKEDTEVVYRSTIALGNLLLSPKTAGGLAVGKVAKGKESIERWAGKESRLGSLAKEIEELGL